MLLQLFEISPTHGQPFRQPYHSSLHIACFSKRVRGEKLILSHPDALLWGDGRSKNDWEILEKRVEDLQKLVYEYPRGPLPQPTFSEGRPKREQVFWHPTLDHGLEQLRFALSWMQSAIKKIHTKRTSQGMDGSFDVSETPSVERA